MALIWYIVERKVICSCFFIFVVRKIHRFQKLRREFFSSVRLKDELKKKTYIDLRRYNEQIKEYVEVELSFVTCEDKTYKNIQI